jgi:hypothetical protein
MTGGRCYRRIALFTIEILLGLANIGVINSLNVRECVSRRTAVAIGSTGLLMPDRALTVDDNVIQDVKTFAYETRDRKSNKEALIREDYWYLTGRLPPRVLKVSLTLDDPQWNAFGSCETAKAGEGTSNSCTYVSLKQRIPAYKKYGYAILDGASEYHKLGALLQNGLKKGKASNEIWDEALKFVTIEGKFPPAIIDAELKMILFATAVLTSPNFPTPGKELLVARYYTNEAHFAAMEMSSAINRKDSNRAIQAWKYGRDSWNSYFQLVNKAISPKVGEPFPEIV